MKGWRPSAIPKGSNPDRALKRANFLPDIGSIGLSFIQEVRSPDFCRIRGRRVPFRALQLAAAKSGKEMAPMRLRSKNGASPSLAPRDRSIPK